MFNFKKAKDMLPSELLTYVGELENEIRSLEGTIDRISKPDVFIQDGSTDFQSEQELIDSMEVGEVVEVLTAKKFAQTFKVKLSKNRIDDHPTRIAAEHAKMLHQV